MNTSRAIVTGGTHDMAFAIGSLLINLQETNKKEYSTLIIYHDGISIEDQEIMSKIGSVEFVLYRADFRNKRFNRSRNLIYFSDMVFSKYECLSLLDKYPQVMWLDYDIFLTGSLEELFQITGHPFITLSSTRPVLASFRKEVSGFDMYQPGMSSGTFLLNQDLGDNSAMLNFCKQQTVRYAHKLKMPEQAIFDLMIQEFSLEPFFIDPEKYALHPDEVGTDSNPAIVHCYGRQKFWSGIEYLPWQVNYQQWLSMGGSPAPLIKPRSKIRKSATFLRRWVNSF